MSITPTTFNALRTDAGLSYRESLVAAAVLPNLPDGEALLYLTGYGSGYYSDEDAVAHFKAHHTGIVNGSNVYRVAYDSDTTRETSLYVEVVPHGRRQYEFNYGDFRLLKPTDPDEYDFGDDGQATLTDYGAGNPYYNPYEANRDAYDRNPRLPV